MNAMPTHANSANMNPASETPDQAPIFSAERIAQILTVPPATPLTPTSEQRAVIEHPLGGSTLVVAGAGSGKTETMANRVVWLVANGLVSPDEVLGLTFTRKAAGELRERISGRLLQFSERLRDAGEQNALTDVEAARSHELHKLLADGLDIPEVSTYNAFAAGVLHEFGVAAGIAPGAAVIDEATSWRIAREVIVASADPELARTDLRLPALIRHVTTLDRLTADHLSSLDRVDQVVTEFTRVLQLPYNEKERMGTPSGKVYAPVRTAVENLAQTPLITRLARAYAAEKQRRGLIEFSDQLAFATRALDGSADAVATLRRRHRVVLLDEVQDTSVGQTRFLAKIFAGASVMAVGDPHQSIYGWRGASAAGLATFHNDFRGVRGTSGSSEPATLTLSTSWRNPSSVLDVANTIAAPLAADAAIDVPVLAPRPGSGTGRVEWAYPETIHDERRLVAEWMRDARAAHLAQHGDVPTAAIIFRTRSKMAGFAAALADAGVPHRIVGLGGLLSTPEVTDVVSALRCLWYADAGGDLIRLLTGPRFRLGVADLAGLGTAARWYAQRDIGHQRLSEDDRALDSVLPDPDRAFTLIDALDQIATLRDLDHRSLAGISSVGRERLREAGRMLADLRQGVGGDIGELIGATAQALRLDIELDANEARPHAGTSAAHANLDVFVELVESFLAIDTHGTLPALLEWIERAQEADETAEHVAAPAPGTVQLITAHGSKGLEWDLVAVPRLVTGEFPSASKEGNGWLATGQLPDELRGDAASRPELHWRIADTQQELRDRIGEYRSELKERFAAEERRLAYVAVTRSADRLLLTGSFWGGQTRARVPSLFLGELAEAGLLRPTDMVTGDSVDGVLEAATPDSAAAAQLPTGSAYEEDPSVTVELTAQWPLDPLGPRAPAVHRAADLVRAHLDDDALFTVDSSGTYAAAAGIDETVRLLLAERQAAIAEREGHAVAPAVDLPDRITASTFHEFVADPVEAERRRLRPVPQRPFRRTRIGNQFHEWVERRATTAKGTALPLLSADSEYWDADLAAFDAASQSESDALADATSDATSAPELDAAAGAVHTAGVSVEQQSEGHGELHAESEDAVALRPLIEQFERSRWAHLQPISVEQEVTLPFAGRSLVCKLDAVYRTADNRIEIVDWKAGRSPRTDAERRTRFFQLDLYRHAYAQWAGVAPDTIDVALFYVAEGVELRGDDPKSLAELESIWRQAAGRLSEPGARADRPKRSAP